MSLFEYLKCLLRNLLSLWGNHLTTQVALVLGTTGTLLILTMVAVMWLQCSRKRQQKLHRVGALSNLADAINVKTEDNISNKEPIHDIIDAKNENSNVSEEEDRLSDNPVEEVIKNVPPVKPSRRPKIRRET